MAEAEEEEKVKEIGFFNEQCIVYDSRDKICGSYRLRDIWINCGDVIDNIAFRYVPPNQNDENSTLGFYLLHYPSDTDGSFYLTIESQQCRLVLADTVVTSYRKLKDNEIEILDENGVVRAELQFVEGSESIKGISFVTGWIKPSRASEAVRVNGHQMGCVGSKSFVVGVAEDGGGVGYCFSLKKREFIVRIDAISNSNYYGHSVVQNLTFTTNLNRTIGPFGGSSAIQGRFTTQTITGSALHFFSACFRGGFLRGLRVYERPLWKRRGWLILLRSLFELKRLEAKPIFKNWERTLKTYRNENGSYTFGNAKEIYAAMPDLKAHVSIQNIKLLLAVFQIQPEIFRQVCLFL